MKNSRAKRIRAAFDEAESDFPGKSEAFVAAIVCDRMQIEYGDVFEALAMTAEDGPASCPVK